MTISYPNVVKWPTFVVKDLRVQRGGGVKISC